MPLPRRQLPPDDLPKDEAPRPARAQLQATPEQQQLPRLQAAVDALLEPRQDL